MGLGAKGLLEDVGVNVDMDHFRAEVVETGARAVIGAMTLQDRSTCENGSPFSWSSFCRLVFAAMAYWSLGPISEQRGNREQLEFRERCACLACAFWVASNRLAWAKEGYAPSPSHISQIASGSCIGIVIASFVRPAAVAGEVTENDRSQLHIN